MNRLCFLLLLAGSAGSAPAEELLSEFSWQQAAASGRLLGGEVVADDVLSVTAPADGQRLALLEIDDPGITKPVYALRGWVRYDGVEGDAYLQMDSHFDGKGTFFSKTLATSGPLRKLNGSSDWREFALPFYANTGDAIGDAPLLPSKLWLGVHFPGAGSLSLKGVTLYQYASGENPLQGMASGSAPGRLGAIAGSLIGLWGAAIGILSALGRGRGFVFGSLNALPVIGVACLAAGVVALLGGQAAGYYYPLILIGIVLLALVGLRRSVRARYEAMELRRMHSLDTEL